MKNLKTISLTFLLLFYFQHAFSQFFIISGDSAQVLSKEFVEKYKINLLTIVAENFQNTYSKDSLKSDEFTLRFPILKVKSNISTFQKNRTEKGLNLLMKQISIGGANKINVFFDEVELSKTAKLYFVSANFNEFAGPILIKT